MITAARTSRRLYTDVVKKGSKPDFGAAQIVYGDIQPLPRSRLLSPVPARATCTPGRHCRASSSAFLRPHPASPPVRLGVSIAASVGATAARDAHALVVRVEAADALLAWRAAARAAYAAWPFLGYQPAAHARVPCEGRRVRPPHGEARRGGEGEIDQGLCRDAAVGLVDDGIVRQLAVCQGDWQPHRMHRSGRRLPFDAKRRGRHRRGRW